MILFLDAKPSSLAAVQKYKDWTLVSWGDQSLCYNEACKQIPEIPSDIPYLGLLDPESNEAMYSVLLQNLRGLSSLKEEPAVAFQGARGAYSEQAIYQYFSKAAVVPCEQFADVFEAVDSGKVRFGMLPIENALTGSIHDNYDLLLQYKDLFICGETFLRIKHHLYGLPDADLSDIRRVFSHPQGLLQCAAYLKNQASWQQVPFYDTAGSVEHIKNLNSRENAAIAGAAAGPVYGMKVLAEGIETNHQNYTRFVVVAKKDESCFPLYLDEPDWKSSVVFSVAHKPGALLQAMRILGDNGFNLSKIESRPIHGSPWEYMFYVDLEFNSRLAYFRKAYAELSEVCDMVRVLGVYPKAAKFVL